MRARDASTPDRRPLRERVREAGGWYAFLNSNLIRVAGPAAVGPYETTPPPSQAERAERACPLCGVPISQHTFDRSGPKPLMHCP
ncbi:hypothetical protein MRBLWH7_001050 [Microbacterium sp. LWH7-1.2]|uniref:hypothetical protein n=1 Tax=Microbacterium sp. LWH7-1.2 TaxID=3135257 RepID=UPI003138CDD0